MRRLLSIDGGGIRGAFPAGFLACIEETLEVRIADYFDLIVGTSTGGIIALALGLGIPASAVVKFYEELGPQVFSGNRLMRFIRWLGFSKYSAQPLQDALTHCFGDRKLGESKTRLVIPSLNLDTGEVYIFKTAHNARYEIDYKKRVVDIALATAAAPTYFPTHRLDAGTPLVDGGMWANNPTVVAAIEAIAVLGWSPDSLRVLSLGCTSPPLNVNWRRSGLIYWADKVADVFMTGQSSASTGITRLLVGRENLFRICPVMPPGRYGLDTVNGVEALRGLGEVEARKFLSEMRSVFVSDPVERFQPAHVLPQSEASVDSHFVKANISPSQ